MIRFRGCFGACFYPAAAEFANQLLLMLAGTRAGDRGALTALVFLDHHLAGGRYDFSGIGR